MSYILFDKNDNVVNPSDLQNRAVWYEHGVSKEQVFIRRYGIQLQVMLNPGKLDDPTVPDLICNGQLSDLKCQDTPFFSAEKYGAEPTFVVTFNLKDALNYGPWGKDYQDLKVFFWVDWVAIRMRLRGKELSVKPLKGVWLAEYAFLEAKRLSRPIHWYRQRDRHIETDPHKKQILQEFEPRLKEGNKIWSIRGSKGNAACSYIFNLNDFQRLD